MTAVQKQPMAAGFRGDISEGKRELLFSEHWLGVGLASSAEVDKRFVQKHLGPASAGMTRKYQRRRHRFRVNLTKVVGSEKPCSTLSIFLNHEESFVIFPNELFSHRLLQWFW
jgi:hypothetical protein